MRRALIQVGGPKGAGKTTLVEAILNNVEGLFINARCFSSSSLKRVREDAGIACPELRRYRDAGASNAARFTFPNVSDAHNAFFESDLMGDYSEAALLEGDNPLEFVDLDIFVAPPLAPGTTMLVRRRRDRARETREKEDDLEKTVVGPEGAVKFLEQIGGASLAEFARQHPGIQERIQLDLLAVIARLREASPPRATDTWTVAKTYHGIERAQPTYETLPSGNMARPSSKKSAASGPTPKCSRTSSASVAIGHPSPLSSRTSWTARTRGRRRRLPVSLA